MRPDQCGTGQRIEDLPDGDREIVEGFLAYLRGEAAMVAKTGEIVPLDRVGEPGIVAVDPPSGAPVHVHYTAEDGEEGWSCGTGG